MTLKCRNLRTQKLIKRRSDHVYLNTVYSIDYSHCDALAAVQVYYRVFKIWRLYGRIFISNQKTVMGTQSDLSYPGRFGGDFLLYVFIGCIAFGLFYSVLSLIFGGGGSDSGIDADGGFDIESGGLSLDADGIPDSIPDAVCDGDAADDPSLFNPVVIASAITAFGAVGLAAMKGFGLSSLVSTVIALAFAGVTGAAIFFGIVRFMYNSQSNSVFSLDDLVGTEAEVITPIPSESLGRIVYIVNGIRHALPARSGEHVGIQRGSRVIIREIAGSEAIVQQKVTLDNIDEYNKKYL